MSGAASPDLHGWRRGQTNRDAVRSLLSTYLGITNREMAERLGLSVFAIGRHVASIRSEWELRSARPSYEPPQVEWLGSVAELHDAAAPLTLEDL